jgi:ribosomal protein S18 acetylase RimI-like enzyme
MIQVRTFDRSDLQQVDAVVQFVNQTGGGGDIIPGIDRVALAWDNGELVGILASRPVEQLHEFRVDPDSVMKRHIAEALVTYAMGAGAAGGCTEAIAVIDKTNTRMIRFFQDAGATIESDGEHVVMSIQIR